MDRGNEDKLSKLYNLLMMDRMDKGNEDRLKGKWQNLMGKEFSSTVWTAIMYKSQRYH